MASHWSFGHLQPTLWAREGPGVKLAIWLPTSKSRESTSSRPPNWKCDMALERSRRGLQLWFRPRRNQTLQSGVMSAQSPETPTGTISGLQLGSLGKNSHLDVAPAERCREYYMGEGGGFPRVRAVVSLVCQSARGMWTNHFVVCFGRRFKLDLLVPLPSLISGLLAHPSTPL
jgi:hypothetical protein